jgi:signal transduction histidine kinase
MKDRRHHQWEKFTGYQKPFPHHHHAWEPRKERFLFRRFFGLIMSGLFLVLVGAVLATIVLHELSGSTMVLIFAGTFLVIMILGAILFIARQVKQITAPIVEVMSAADSVAKGDFSIRISGDYSGEFKALADSFNKMVAELEDADEQRRKLTADVAHELRTPLHILQGNLEGMQDGVYPLDESQLRLLLDETKTLSHLVDDLQILTLAENQQLALTYEDIDLDELLSDVVVQFSSQAESLGIETFYLPPSEKICLYADRSRLNQVLDNLFANALRHTPSGGKIKVLSWKRKNEAVIQVIDTGNGIPEEDLPHIFDRFWKGDPARSRHKGTGSGLGLSIAKGIIDMHHGSIHAKSEVGKGTVFTIKLPLNREDAC